METEARATIRKKIATYFSYYFSNDWKNSLTPRFPTVIFVCLTQKRLTTLLQDIELQLQKYNFPSVIFKIATFETLEKNGFEKPIWYIPTQKEKVFTLF